MLYIITTDIIPKSEVCPSEEMDLEIIQIDMQYIIVPYKRPSRILFSKKEDKTLSFSSYPETYREGKIFKTVSLKGLSNIPKRIIEEELKIKLYRKTQIDSKKEVPKKEEYQLK